MKAGRSARYEEHAHAQRAAAHDLLAFTGTPKARTILEPGCGTGLYSRMLLAAFPGADILAVDVSAEKIREARNGIPSPAIRFAAADAEELPCTAFDLITSNAALQWFNNLPRTLARYARMLSDGGVLSFSFFGPRTYEELDGALRDAFPGSARVAASGFAGKAAVSGALSAAFPHWEIEEKIYAREFPSVAELLRSIRCTDTRGTPRGGRIAWTRGALSRLEDAYRDRWGGIRATSQVFLCRGGR